MTQILISQIAYCIYNESVGIDITLKIQMQTPLPYSDSDFNQIIVELYKKTQLPLKSSDLVTRYTQAVFKVKQCLPDSEHDSTYELVLRMNFEAVSQQTRNLRLSLLQLWKDRLIEQITIENCLPTLSVKLLDNKVTQDFVDNIKEIFDFSVSFKDENQRISKCFDDLQMLFLKITENIMVGYELKDEFFARIQQEIQRIRKDLLRFCEEYFYYFHVGIDKDLKKAVKQTPFEVPKVPQMERIKSSFRKYQDKVTNEVGVSTWLLPENILKENLKNEELAIKNQIKKTFHNKADFQLKVKPKFYELLRKNGSKPKFDFLPKDKCNSFMQIIEYVLHEINTVQQARDELKSKVFSLTEKGLQYDFVKQFIDSAPKTFQPKWNPESQQINLLAMINLFLLLESNYNCVDRQFLRHVFRYLKNFEYGYSNFKILTLLQNMNKQNVEKLNLHPTVSQIFESQTIPTAVFTQISKLTTATEASDPNNTQIVPKEQERSILQLLRAEQIAAANKQIQILMNRINVEKLSKSLKKLPMMEFQKISNPKTQSRVVTICVSGFISQDDVMDQSWRNLIKQHEGQVYALKWESKKTEDMIKYTWKRIEGLVVNKIFFNVPILNIMTIIKTLIEAYKANPFYSAFEEAIQTGKMLGTLLKEIFPNCLINLIGFSLGTQLIKQCIKVLKKQENQGMINKAIFIGGVADRGQLKQVLHNTPFESYNFYSANDQILKVLYKICKPMNHPCGLGTVEGALVENIDCTEFIDGHGRYRAEFEEICRRIQLEDDTHYYYQ